MTAQPTSTESSLSHIVPIFMRVALFSLIDDWEVGPRMAENGHEIVAWIKPVWAPDKSRPAIVRRAARLARVLASQAKPPTSVPRIYNAAEWIDRLGIERVSCANVNDPEFVSRLQAIGRLGHRRRVSTDIQVGDSRCPETRRCELSSVAPAAVRWSATSVLGVALTEKPSPNHDPLDDGTHRRRRYSRAGRCRARWRRTLVNSCNVCITELPR